MSRGSPRSRGIYGTDRVLPRESRLDASPGSASGLGIGQVACLMNFGGPDPDLAYRSIRFFGQRLLPRLG